MLISDCRIKVECLRTPPTQIGYCQAILAVADVTRWQLRRLIWQLRPGIWQLRPLIWQCHGSNHPYCHCHPLSKGWQLAVMAVTNTTPERRNTP